MYVKLKNASGKPLLGADGVGGGGGGVGGGGGGVGGGGGGVGGGGGGVGGGFDGGGVDVAVVTLTDTESDLLGSATLVAVTVSVPARAGALYIPELLIVPRTAFQVTDLFVVVPCTLAVNGKVPEVIEDAFDGDIDTEVTATEVTAWFVQPMANKKHRNNGDPDFQLGLHFILHLLCCHMKMQKSLDCCKTTEVYC